MKNKKESNDLAGLPHDPFAYIGFWQFLTFIMLLLVVWVNELRDVPALLFGTTQHGPNIFRGCILSAGVFLTAAVTIGNTYAQQRRVLRALISVCAKCHRVRVNNTRWQRMEDYISEHSLLSFSHGLCPICMEETMRDIEEHRKLAHGEKDITPGRENESL